MARNRYRTPVVVTPLGRYECRHCAARFAWQSERPEGGGKPPAYCSDECQSASRREYRGDCPVCGTRVLSHKPATYCSLSCSASARRKPRKPKPPRPPKAQPPPRPRFVAGLCARCGTPFVHDWSSRYCSDKCAKRQAKDRRRARKRAAYVEDVNRLKVFERDKWTCHLCHRRIWRYRDMKPPHPRSPTIDHVVPFDRDGTHEPANVALACFWCNSNKGNRGGGEQLALVG